MTDSFEGRSPKGKERTKNRALLSWARKTQNDLRRLRPPQKPCNNDVVGFAARTYAARIPLPLATGCKPLEHSFARSGSKHSSEHLHLTRLNAITVPNLTRVDSNPPCSPVNGLVGEWGDGPIYGIRLRLLSKILYIRPSFDSRKWKNRSHSGLVPVNGVPVRKHPQKGLEDLQCCWTR